MTALVPVSAEVSPALAALDAEAREYLEKSTAENTRRAYRADWADFTSWCDNCRVISLPAAPETVVRYLTARAKTSKVATLSRRLVVIAKAHRARGVENPTDHPLVRGVWRGIRREHGTASRGKAALLTDDIRRMVNGVPPTLAGKRDRALLLVGFLGAFRRSEIVGLDVADLRFVDRRGVEVTLRRSKTDQEGEGRMVPLPLGATAETCPARSLKVWLAAAEITEGPVFRAIDRHGNVRPGRLSGHAVATVVKAAAARAGLDAAEIGGHSLRAGFVTSAAEAGAEERNIMRQTGHRSTEMVRRYVRHGTAWKENAAAQLGL